MQVDILYLAHNRLEFTKASSAAMLTGTDWRRVRRVVIYDDASEDGTQEFVRSLRFPVETLFRPVDFGSPVAVMNDYLSATFESHPLGGPPASEVFAKIDSDTMLPPAWLGDCLSILEQNPTVDLLGIEPHHPVAATAPRRYVEPAGFIGGIGLMRRRAFQYGLPRPDGRFGFTAWQDHESQVQKAWINPALPVFLLDRMPMEPWASLSAEYVAQGWQRPWEKYTPDQAAMWEWWKA